MPDKSLDLADGAELAELLQFLRDWIDTDHEHLDPSLRTFVGSHGYDTHQLRDDLDRLSFLLGGNDGEPSPQPPTRNSSTRWGQHS